MGGCTARQAVVVRIADVRPALLCRNERSTKQTFLIGYRAGHALLFLAVLHVCALRAEKKIDARASCSRLVCRIMLAIIKKKAYRVAGFYV